MRKALRWLTLLLLPLLCTACWDSTDIDKLAIVTATGFDTPPSDGQSTSGVLVTAQLARPSDLGTTGGGGAPSSSTGTTKTFVLEQAQAENAMSAAETIGKRLSRKLFLGHRRVIIMGEDYAKSGLSDVMDEVIRNPTSRFRTFIVVAYQNRAEDLLKLPYALDRLPSEAIAAIERGGAVAEVDAKAFVQQMSEEGVDPYAMGIKQVPSLHNVSGKGKETFDLDNIAVFRDDKLVGWLTTPEQMRGFYWMQGKLKRESATVHVPGSSGAVSMRLLTLRSSFRPSMENRKPRMTVQVQAQFDVVQNSTQLNLTRPSDIQKLRKAITDEMDRQIQSALTALQKQYQSDALGFGRKFHQRFPNQWKQMGSHWREVYSQLPVTLQPTVRIRASGLVQQRIPANSTPGG